MLAAVKFLLRLATTPQLGPRQQERVRADSACGHPRVLDSGFLPEEGDLALGSIDFSLKPA
jgi:hypothetical protein